MQTNALILGCRRQETPATKVINREYRRTFVRLVYLKQKNLRKAAALFGDKCFILIKQFR